MTTLTDQIVSDILANIAKGPIYITEKEKQEVRALPVAVVMQRLRDGYEGGRWKLSHQNTFEDFLIKQGFTVTQGRTERFYHGGKKGLGVIATIVTI